jgi:hypothetical protein
MHDFAEKIFLVHRTDGFGARLSCMVDAIFFAQALGGRFAFHWPDSGLSRQENAILPRSDTFAPEFLDTYHAGAADIRALAVKPLHAVQSRFAEAMRADSGIDGFVIGWEPIASYAPRLADVVPLQTDRRAAFAAIRFSPALEHARRLAETIPLPAGVAAIHLRAGDIVYGRFRASGFHHDKVVPYPLTLRIMERLAGAGTPILVFGQDRAIAEHAKRQHGAVLAAELAERHGFSDAQQALFEICLMARCSSIHAGTSAFAITASKISGVVPEHPGRVFSAAEAKALIDQALSRDDEAFPPLQKAMAAWHYVIAARYDIAAPDCGRMAAEASRHDPANPYYPAVRAVSLYATGKLDEAEQLMLRALTDARTDPELLVHLIGWLPRARAISEARNVAALRAAALAGRPVAALVLALQARTGRKPEDYNAHAALYQANRTPDMPEEPGVFFARRKA